MIVPPFYPKVPQEQVNPEKCYRLQLITSPRFPGVNFRSVAFRADVWCEADKELLPDRVSAGYRSGLSGLALPAPQKQRARPNLKHAKHLPLIER